MTLQQSTAIQVPKPEFRPAFALLDAARVGSDMSDAHGLEPNGLSLYKGMSEESLSDVAPYVFPFGGSEGFAAWLVAKGRGKSWGVFIETTVSIDEIHRHLRKFLMVRTEDGRELYFRFYDPRVLRIFLGTCSPSQLSELFGPVAHYAAEDENPAFMLVFTLGAQGLETQRVPRTDYFGAAAT
jgi:hypothetical protein